MTLAHECIVTDRTFDEYWRNYLAGHARLSTRLVHYFGLIFGPLIGIALSLTVVWWAFFAVYPVCYGAAFLTHPFLEDNTNRGFAARPLWSVFALFRMLWLDATGQLSKQ
jgi:hypothetical protein